MPFHSGRIICQKPCYSTHTSKKEEYINIIKSEQYRDNINCKSKKISSNDNDNNDKKTIT